MEERSGATGHLSDDELDEAEVLAVVAQIDRLGVNNTSTTGPATPPPAAAAAARVSPPSLYEEILRYQEEHGQGIVEENAGTQNDGGCPPTTRNERRTSDNTQNSDDDRKPAADPRGIYRQPISRGYFANKTSNIRESSGEVSVSEEVEQISSSEQAPTLQQDETLERAQLRSTERAQSPNEEASALGASSLASREEGVSGPVVPKESQGEPPPPQRPINRAASEESLGDFLDINRDEEYARQLQEQFNRDHIHHSWPSPSSRSSDVLDAESEALLRQLSGMPIDDNAQAVHASSRRHSDDNRSSSQCTSDPEIERQREILERFQKEKEERELAAALKLSKRETYQMSKSKIVEDWSNLRRTQRWRAENSLSSSRDDPTVSSRSQGRRTQRHRGTRDYTQSRRAEASASVVSAGSVSERSTSHHSVSTRESDIGYDRHQRHYRHPQPGNSRPHSDPGSQSSTRSYADSRSTNPRVVSRHGRDDEADWQVRGHGSRSEPQRTMMNDREQRYLRQPRYRDEASHPNNEVWYESRPRGPRPGRDDEYGPNPPYRNHGPSESMQTRRIEPNEYQVRHGDPSDRGGLRQYPEARPYYDERGDTYYEVDDRPFPPGPSSRGQGNRQHTPPHYRNRPPDDRPQYRHPPHDYAYDYGTIYRSERSFPDSEQYYRPRAPGRGPRDNYQDGLDERGARGNLQEERVPVNSSRGGARHGEETDWQGSQQPHGRPPYRAGNGIPPPETPDVPRSVSAPHRRNGPREVAFRDTISLSGHSTLSGEVMESESSGGRDDIVIRGQRETERAVQAGEARIVECQRCHARLQAPLNYQLVYCPTCGMVSPCQN